MLYKNESIEKIPILVGKKNAIKNPKAKKVFAITGINILEFVMVENPFVKKMQTFATVKAIIMAIEKILKNNNVCFEYNFMILPFFFTPA